MGLGFSKIFAVVLIFAIAWAYYIRDWKAIFPILIPYIILKIIWNLLTQKKS